MNISPLAVVHPEAQIGQNVTIDPFAVIEKDVVIGDNCHIYSHAVILDGARIGKNCNIFPGAVVAGIPQDMKFAGETTTAEIGDNTTLRECVTINRGTASKGKTVVGRNCLIMAYSHVAHDCVLKDHIIIGNASQIAGEVEIDDFAIVSGGSLVHQFTRISKHVMVQGGSRIGKDIPPYIYRTLYTRGLNNTEALKAIETEYEPSEERDLILNFIKSSSRGIVRGSIDE